jgi:hypothetical protein
LPPAALQVLNCAKDALPDRDADDVVGQTQFIDPLGGSRRGVRPVVSGKQSGPSAGRTSRPGSSSTACPTVRGDSRQVGGKLQGLLEAIPAAAFFEFTGQRTPKTKHRFTLAGQPFFCIAGIWRDGATGETSACSRLRRVRT